MSASRSSYSKQERVFTFSMEFPVPSYLVALVAGDLQHVDVGPRFVSDRVRKASSDAGLVTFDLHVYLGAVCGRSHACCPVQ